MSDCNLVQLPSRCSWKKPHRPKIIKNQSNEVLGVLCQYCWKEWLPRRYVEKHVLGEEVHLGGKDLYRRRGRKRQLVKSSFSAATSRQEVSPDQVMSLLEPGDHIMWRRTYVLWHHAIVIGASGYYIRIIHWSIDENGKVTVHDYVTNALEEIGVMYKVIYSQQVLDSNPTSLVLARAATLLGTTGYSILDRHCENFAVFCKTGINTNAQFHWIVMKMICQELGTVFQMTKVAPDVIVLHQLFNGPAVYKGLILLLKLSPKMSLARVGAVLMRSVGQYIGAALVILVEGVFCAWDIHCMRSHYKTPVSTREGRSLSRNDFVVEATIRTSEAVIGALGTILAAIGFEILLGGSIGMLFGPAGAVVGVVIGCVVGGTVGGVIGRTAGNVLGNLVGRVIVKTFKTNDRVATIDNVEPGDHLVFNKGIAHPRCHAIVIEVNHELGHVTVIKNTYSRGVVKTTETFNQPVYRVTYKERISLYSKREIVDRALAAHEAQNRKYNILTANCKHFVYSITIKRRVIHCGRR